MVELFFQNIEDAIHMKGKLIFIEMKQKIVNSITKISLLANFGFSQKLPEGIGFFQSIMVAKIINECWKVESVLDNKFDIFIYSWTGWSVQAAKYSQIQSKQCIMQCNPTKIRGFLRLCALNINVFFYLGMISYVVWSFSLIEQNQFFILLHKTFAG